MQSANTFEMQVHENRGINFIAAASSSTAGDANISIWTSCSRRENSGAHQKLKIPMLLDIIQAIMRLTVAIAAIAFISQNITVTVVSHQRNR